MNLAHIGLSLRATGQGLRVLLVGCLPHQFVETEDRALSFLEPNVTVRRLPLTRRSPGEDLPERDQDKIRSTLSYVKDIILGGSYDIVILEEMNKVVDMGLIPLSTVIDMIEKKSPHLELVLTGGNARDEIVAKADLVTEMIELKRGDISGEIEGYGKEGSIEVITGGGKGKTTHCLGRAMFFAANGIRSIILQFVKSPQAYGESIAVARFPALKIQTMGEGFVLGSAPPLKKHREAARAAWEVCLREIFSLNYRLIVLDEINIATELGLVHPERVREMMFLKPKNLHIILSGRGAHPEVMEHASAVLEMREVKHPFQRGIGARKGIEF